MIYGHLSISCPFYAGAQRWNSIPQYIKDARSIVAIRTSLKTHFLSWKRKKIQTHRFIEEQHPGPSRAFRGPGAKPRTEAPCERSEQNIFRSPPLDGIKENSGIILTFADKKHFEVLNPGGGGYFTLGKTGMCASFG